MAEDRGWPPPYGVDWTEAEKRRGKREGWIEAAGCFGQWLLLLVWVPVLLVVGLVLRMLGVSDVWFEWLWNWMVAL